MKKQFAVFVEPSHVLVGVEKEDFSIIQLAEKYGCGTYTVMKFVDGKLDAEFRQVIDPNLGPPKNRNPLPVENIPGSEVKAG